MKRLILILLVFTGLAQARNWVHLATDANKVEWYADLESIRYRQSSEYVSAWIKSVDPDGSYMLTHDDFHLTADQYRFLSIINYRPGGTVSGTDPCTACTWADIVPDSVMDYLYHVLFKKPQQRQSQEY